jgi:IS5 family transposase
MLTLYNNQPDLWEAILPPELQGLPQELKAIDDILKDETFLKPFEAALAQKVKEKIFSSNFGRPSTALSSYVRMMILKFRHGYSYEDLEEIVRDSIIFRRFCGFGLSDAIPDSTTLIKLTNKLGEDFIHKLNQAVVQEAAKRGIARGRKMRLDTTVVESNIHYPTDTGLLSDAVRVVTRTVKKIKEVVKIKTRFRNCTRAIKTTLLHMLKFLKGTKGKTKEAVTAAKRKVLAMAQGVLAQAIEVLKELKNPEYKDLSTESTDIMKVVKATTLESELRHWMEMLKRVIAQTKTVLSGQMSIPDRLVSIFDPGARPIQKGKLFPDTEFGRKALIQEAEHGIITNYEAHDGNPPDVSLLEGAVDTHEKIFGEAPAELAADRGFYQSEQQEELKERGIKHVSIPVKGSKDGMEKRRERSAWFRRLQRWRAGGEAEISLFKRVFGGRRSLVRGTSRVAGWIGWAVAAHNLWRMARVINSG